MGNTRRVNQHLTQPRKNGTLREMEDDMSDVKDGGAAFPTGNPTQGGHEGMTLRDWFAGQALAGLAAHMEENSPLTREADAETIYKWADAMLAQREGER